MLSLILHSAILLSSLGFTGQVVDSSQNIPRLQTPQVAQAIFEKDQERVIVASNVLRQNTAYLKRLKARQAELRTMYNAELLKVDRLKRSRASFGRDRKLRQLKARAQKIAILLLRSESRLHKIRKKVALSQRKLVESIALELDNRPTTVRKQHLLGILRTIKGYVKKAPKKITLPDVEFDPFADPEELLEQIALIERAEERLSKEQDTLLKRGAHFEHMDRLRAQRTRSNEIAMFDPTGVRRTTGHVVASSERATSEQPKSKDSSPSRSPSLPENSSSDPAPEQTEENEGGSLAVYSVILADVLDHSTQDALKRAQQSRSPRAKAVAAKRARMQVKQNLRRLRLGREQIQRHLNRIRKR